MSSKDFLNIGLETTKGSALFSLKDEGAAGAYDFAVFDFSGVAVDQERFKLGDDVYEIQSILTDTAAESTGVVGAADQSVQFDQAFDIAVVQGDVIRMEDEYMIIIDYDAVNFFAHVHRGQFGSTAVEHSIANSDTFQAAQAVLAGALSCPIDDTAAAAVVADVALAVEFWKTGYSKGLGGGIGVRVENSLKVDAFSGTADSVVFAYEANGGVAPAHDGTDAATVNFTDGGAGEDYMTRTDGGSWVEEGVIAGEDITIASAVANDGTYEVLSVSDTVIYVATASWTDEAQADAITVAQEFCQTNATLTVFGGGVEPASQVYSRVVFKAGATTAVSYVAPWTVLEAYVTIWGADGAIIEAAANTVAVAGRLVTISADGSLADGVLVELVMLKDTS